ncbi:MAG: insulinase family protein [Deltaproteobacteria bacterium]|nr:MAG: insulinase family protein [Deltaproteobacteria bacterium]
MYKRTILDNGMRVVTERISHLHSVSMGIWLNVGSRDEAESESGLTHFIEHMLFKGTKKRSALEIAKQLDAVGGMSNAFTSKENTCFHAKVLDAHLPLVVDILADIFLHSVFDHQEVEREREVILQEINMVEDTPDEYVHVLFNQAFWDGNPLARPIFGNAQTVQSFTREIILGYLNRGYHPDRIVLSAAGNVDHQEFLELVDPAFRNVKRHSHDLNRTPPTIVPGVELYPRDLEQIHLCLGTRGTSLVEDERYCCSILNVILGGSMSSRLFQEVRERRGLAYSIYSFLSSHTDSGMMGIYGAVRPDNIKETRAVIRHELRSLKQEPISDVELRAAKEHIKGGIYLAAENTDNRMSRLAKNEMIFGRFVTYEEIEAGLEKVTSEDVQALAQEIFRPEVMSSVLLGQVDGLGVDQTFLDL